MLTRPLVRPIVAPLVRSLTAPRRGTGFSPLSLYDPALAEDGFVYNTGNGAKAAFANSIISGKVPVEEGKSYYMALPPEERGLFPQLFFYGGVAGATYIGVAKTAGATFVVPGVDLILGPNGAGATGGVQWLIFTIPLGSGITFFGTHLLTGYLAHDTAYFDRVRKSVTMYAVAKKTDGGNVGVTKAGSTIYVRGALSETKDIVQQIQLSSGNNNTVNVQGARTCDKRIVDDASAWTTGTVLVTQGDSTAPVKINGVYIGGNHGCSAVQEVTATAHGKTVADVGSEWIDTSTRKWYLMKIIDANKLWFLSENLSAYPLWSFASLIAGTTLAHSSGATNTGLITIASRVSTQLWPALQSQTTDVLLDGISLTADGSRIGKSVAIVNTYKITNPAAVVSYVRSQVGGAVQPSFIDPSIASDVERSLAYRYAENGSCEVTDGIRMVNAQTLTYFGATQSEALNFSSKQLWQYVPKVLPKVGTLKTWDFQAQEDISGTFEQLAFVTSDWTDANNPPDRLAQIVKTAGVAEFGLMLGYNPTRGIGVPAVRKTLINEAAFISVAKKQYPEAMNIGPLVAGALYELPAFRSYWSAESAPDATTFAWYRDSSNGHVIVVADFHQNVSMSLLKLPQHLVGMLVSVVDKSASATVHSSVLDANGVPVSITGGYGYVVLQLSTP